MFLASGLTLKLAHAEELRRLPPPEGKSPDPRLADLIGHMRKIVSSHDGAALEAMMSPTFRVEFDVGKGPASFRRQWRPESPGSAVWNILQHLLEIPGYLYSDTLFAVPYVFARFPFDMNPLQYVVAIKSQVPLFAQPKSDARRVGSLDYSIVPLVRPSPLPVIFPAGSFLEVQHPTAGRCFVSSADICHPAGHRLFFEKRAGRWRWISLAAATIEDPPDLKRHTVSAG